MVCVARVSARKLIHFWIITDIVEDIIDILETLLVNHLPYKVKMFFKNCDITIHQYNQHTLTGASDSLLGFCLGHFDTMNINNYQLNPEWKDWKACQQTEPESEPAAATYTSSEDNGGDNNCISLNKEDWYDNNDNGYYNNYISRDLCGTGPVNQQNFTI